MKFIPLTRDEYAIVDNENYEFLSQFKWHVGTGGSNHSSFYACTYINAKLIQMPWLLIKRKINSIIDHKNRNTLDNRKFNLRLASIQENIFNRSGHQKSTSCYKGVSRASDRHKWRIQIQKDYKIFYSGYYGSEIVAAWVYDQMAKNLFGEFAVLNFPLTQPKQAAIFKKDLGLREDERGILTISPYKA